MSRYIPQKEKQKPKIPFWVGSINLQGWSLLGATKQAFKVENVKVKEKIDAFAAPARPKIIIWIIKLQTYMRACIYVIEFCEGGPEEYLTFEKKCLQLKQGNDLHYRSI